MESVTHQFEILFDEKGSINVNLIELLKNSKGIKICDSNLGDPIIVKEIGQVL